MGATLTAPLVLVPKAKCRSQYDNKCPCCRTPIEIGDPLHGAYRRGEDKKIWVCDSCAAKAGRTTPGPDPGPPAPDRSSEVDALLARTRQLESTVGELLNLTRDIPDPERLAKLVAVAEKGVGALARYDDRLRAVEQATPVIVEVKVTGQPPRQLKGRQHRVLPDLLQLAACRENIYLVGPKGSGKTTIAKSLAESLGLRFGHISCSGGMAESHLTGRLLPIGDAGRFEFVMAEFLDVYENGGVFLLDEIDACDPNVLIVINCAIDNGWCSVPNRPQKPRAERHPDFVLVAAANTWGNGADRQYCGRNQIDAATLDRFSVGFIAMDYDPEIEAEIVPDDGFRDHFQAIRARVRAAKLQRDVSMRFLGKAWKMHQEAGWTIERCEQALFGGWTADEIRKAKAS